MVSPRAIRQRQRYAEDPEFRERKLAINRKHRAANKDEINARRRLNRYRHYGLRPEDYRALLVGQGNGCAICRSRLPLGVDHCHSTKQVRGLLCSKCNLGLGHYDDDTARMLAAVAYLEVSRQPIGKSKAGTAIAAEIVERLHRRLKLAVRAAFALRGRRGRGRPQDGGKSVGREQGKAGPVRKSGKSQGPGKDTRPASSVSREPLRRKSPRRRGKVTGRRR